MPLSPLAVIRLDSDDDKRFSCGSCQGTEVDYSSMTMTAAIGFITYILYIFEHIKTESYRTDALELA